MCDWDTGNYNCGQSGGATSNPGSSGNGNTSGKHPSGPTNSGNGNSQNVININININGSYCKCSKDILKLMFFLMICIYFTLNQFLKNIWLDEYLFASSVKII